MQETRYILGIDDEEIIRTCFERTLKPAGYMVHTVSTGMEGIELARDNKYDLVLLDLKMPAMDGEEVAERLAKIQPGVKIIVVTGHADADTAELVEQMGGACYLEKPFFPKALLKSVDEVLGEE
jgi:DNA-binding NtrC family response regulator